MKLLLTSAGIKNKSLVKVLTDLVGKPVNEISVIFIPTGEGECLVLDNFKKHGKS